MNNKNKEYREVYLSPGNYGFSLQKKKRLFVDHSLLIDMVIDQMEYVNRFIAMIRPRRFGKTSDLQMLAAYFDKSVDSSDLFDDLKIASTPSYQKHLNKHTVLSLNMHHHIASTKTMDEMIDDFESAVKAELKEEFTFDMHLSLPKVLDFIYRNQGETFVILCDEFDEVFRNAKYSTKDREDYVEYLSLLFKDRSYVALAYITGILPPSFYGTQSSLNCFTEVTMFKPKQYSHFMGFTLNEVKELCKKVDGNFEKAKYWYNGYRIKNDDMYNPKSVVEALNGDEYTYHWVDTDTFQTVENYIIHNNQMRDHVDELLAGKRVKFKPIYHSINFEKVKSDAEAFTVLVYLGYLAYDFNRKEIYIPNNEIRERFLETLKSYNYGYVSRALQKSDELLEATRNQDEEKVASIIEDIHNMRSSIHYNRELSVVVTLLLAYYSAQEEYYEPIEEYPSGKGYVDLVFIPRFDAIPMIIECKWNKSSEEAMKQIHEKKYYLRLKDYDHVLLVGINYDSDTKVHSCKIETYGINSNSRSF